MARHPPGVIFSGKIRRMRINGPNGIAQPPAQPQLRRTGPGGFVLPGDRPSETAAARTTSGLSGVDVLLALQGVPAAEDATERRRRQMKRGHAALDALEVLRLGLIDGRLDMEALARLGSVAASPQEETGDSELDDVLKAVDLRSQVELAKIEAARRRR